MPVYEYACKACGQHLEVAQSFQDEPLTTCPLCQGQLRKVFGSIGISFKGSGFYRTDSRTPSGKPTDRGDKAKVKEAEAGSGDKAKSSSAEKAGSGSTSSPSGSEGSTGSAKEGPSASSAAKIA